MAKTCLETDLCLLVSTHDMNWFLLQVDKEIEEKYYPYKTYQDWLMGNLPNVDYERLNVVGSQFM